MEEGNRSPKSKTALFVLGIVVAMLVLFIAIPWITNVRDANHPIDVHDTAGSSTVAVVLCPDDTRDALFEVPDEISGRGLILRGGMSEDGYYRSGTSGTPNWFMDYVTDCNLMIDGTDEEFEEFALRLDENAGFPGSEPDFPPYYSATINIDDHPYTIYRTEYITWDCSEGYIDTHSPSYDTTVPTFFDPSGRYIFALRYYDDIDEILLRFLEPVMSRVEVTFADGSSESSSDDEVIGRFVDSFHELEAIETEDDADTILAEGGITQISFTTAEGNVHDYFLTDTGCLVYNGQVYSISAADSLNDLLRNES